MWWVIMSHNYALQRLASMRALNCWISSSPLYLYSAAQSELNFIFCVNRIRFNIFWIKWVIPRSVIVIMSHTLSIRLSNTPSKQVIALLWSEIDESFVLKLNVSGSNVQKAFEFRDNRSKLYNLPIIGTSALALFRFIVYSTQYSLVQSINNSFKSSILVDTEPCNLSKFFKCHCIQSSIQKSCRSVEIVCNAMNSGCCVNTWFLWWCSCIWLWDHSFKDIVWSNCEIGKSCVVRACQTEAKVRTGSETGSDTWQKV